MNLVFMEQNYLICHCPDAKRGVWLEDNKIMVSGNIKELGIRVERFLKQEVGKRFKQRTRLFAKQLNLNVANVRIKDTVSRWGSCSSKNNINLNWRLGFAPNFISDYVIIHELSHLIVKGHNQAFWNEVKKYCPDYKTARLWLKQNGKELFSYQGKL